MKHSDFKIGEHFYTWWAGDSVRAKKGPAKFLCTDIGTRVVVAIQVDVVSAGGALGPLRLSEAEAAALGWFNGPPYAMAERVFDEAEIEGCAPSPDDL